MRFGASASLVSLVAFGLLFGPLGCATDPGASDPGDIGLAFPARGLSVAQTLSGLYRRDTDDRLTVHKVEILQMDASPWRSLDAKEARRLTKADGNRYAIVANRLCTSQSDSAQGYRGQHVDWFLFENGRLEAYDYMEFGFMCLMRLEYLPARGEQVAREHEVADFAKKNFPVSREYHMNTYQRGIWLAGYGRIEEAEEMLRQADSVQDQMTTDRVFRREGGKGANVARGSDREQARQRLVEAIRDAKAGYRLPVPTPVGSEEDLEHLRAEAAQRDSERLAEWQEKQAERRFVESEAGWRVVSENELRKGPKPGEEWVSYDEMQRIKAESAPMTRPVSSSSSPKPAAPPQPAAKSSAAPEPALFVQRGGTWIEVDEGMREEGPREGEVFLHRQEMEIQQLQQQLEEAGYE